MRKIVNPKQKLLFDPFDKVLTLLTRKRLLGWHGVFRHVILELMPVKELSKSFSPTQGRPTKELYSMAGLILDKDFGVGSTRGLLGGRYSSLVSSSRSSYPDVEGSGVGFRVASVPEPSSLLIISVAGLFLRKRRRNN